MRVAPTPARMAPIARAKWQLFRLLERFSDLWGREKTFPSYPAYRMLSDAGALLEARSSAALAAHWWRVIASPSEAGLSFAPAEVALDAARGAVARHFDAIESVLPGVVLPGASPR